MLRRSGTTDESSSKETAEAPARRWTWAFWWIVAAFFLVRLPVTAHQPGGEDEECYAVPGLTILKTGLPQLPHVPARNKDSVYYGADRMLYAEPPLMFYLQAVLYAFLPHVYGTARLLSLLGGIGVLWMVWRLAAWSTQSDAAAAIATGLFSMSRWFYFPAIRARPDILAVFFGLLALWWTTRWLRTGRYRDLVGVGVAIGLGGLCHFFAIVYAVQIAVWLAWSSRGWKRLWHPLVVAGASLVIFSAWLPLIWMEPEVFRIQFGNQIFREQELSLLRRLIFPGDSLLYHFWRAFVAIGLWQFSIGITALLVASVRCMRRSAVSLAAICLLAWTAMFLLSCLVGPGQTKASYWAYPAALMFICLGALLEQFVRNSGHHSPWRKRLALLAVAGMFLSMLPGLGLRTTLVHLRRWSDINYNEPAFARALLDQLPIDQTYVVDVQYALDFVAAGRRTLLAPTSPNYLRLADFHYDTVVSGRYNLEMRLPQQLCLETLDVFGVKEDPFACYAEIGRPPKEPCETQSSAPDSPAAPPVSLQPEILD
jgi:4-amino-4-deoxy-L-arabinose transferase-like glycosyltransferase